MPGRRHADRPSQRAGRRPSAEHPAGRARQPAGRPAGTPARLERTGCTVTSSATRWRRRFDRLLFFDVRGRPTPGLRARCSSRACGHSSATSVGARVGCCSPSATGPSTSPASWACLAGPARDQPLELRVAGDRQLPRVHAPRLRRRARGSTESRRRSSGTPRCAGVAGLDLSLAPILIWRETRTGFTGSGHPRAHQHVRGHPAWQPGAGARRRCSWASSRGCSKNQATEDDVTIRTGPFAEGTTMQVSYMRLQLDDWYGKLSAGRAGRAHVLAADDGCRRPSGSRPTPRATRTRSPQAITHYGVIGHAQASCPGAAPQPPGDHPPRLRHRRRRPRRPALRLRAALDRGLRRHPQRDERDRRPQHQQADHRAPPTTASTPSSTCAAAPTT